MRVGEGVRRDQAPLTRRLHTGAPARALCRCRSREAAAFGEEWGAAARRPKSRRAAERQGWPRSWGGRSGRPWCGTELPLLPGSGSAGFRRPPREQVPGPGWIRLSGRKRKRPCARRVEQLVKLPGRLAPGASWWWGRRAAGRPFALSLRRTRRVMMPFGRGWVGVVGSVSSGSFQALGWWSSRPRVSGKERIPKALGGFVDTAVGAGVGE